jgi:hypothetical protein
VTPEEEIARLRDDRERSIDLDAASGSIEPEREPPIVARCVVEVRSDGSMSIARGIFETKEQSVLLEGKGRTPAELVAMLARGAFTQARVRLQDTLHGLEHKLLGGEVKAR